MLRNTLASLLALTLTGAALAQESAIVGAFRPDAIDGRAGTKLVFTAVGQADDVVVLRMTDGTLIAEATLMDLAKGASFDAALAPQKVAGKKSTKPSVQIFAQAIDLSAQASPMPTELGKPLDVVEVAMKSAPSLGTGDSGKIELGTAELEAGSMIRDTKPASGTIDASASGNVAVKSALAADPKPFAVLITISKAPAKFHGGSVALYRGKSILDADRINLR